MPVKVFISTPVLFFEELRAAQEDIRQRQGQLAGQINIGMGASISRSLMPAVISRFHQQHPQVKVRIMEGQLVSMINELRQGELDFTINTYYQGPYDHEFTFEKLLEKQFAIFCRQDTRHWCPFDQTVTGLQLDNADATRQLLQTVE